MAHDSECDWFALNLFLVLILDFCVVQREEQQPSDGDEQMSSDSGSSD